MKAIIKNTYVWGALLVIFGFATFDKEKNIPTLMLIAGLALLAFSIIRSVYRFIIRLFKKPSTPVPGEVASEPVAAPSEPVAVPSEPVDGPVEPATNSEQTDSYSMPLEIHTVVVPKRTSQSNTVKNIHNIERFHKLENNVFSRKARKNGFVVFDLETTGLKAYDRICEIAAIKYDNQFHPLEGFETLVNPERAIAPEASAKSGIYDDMVSDSPTIDQVLPVFFSFVEGYPLIGYNAERFDIRYLNNAVNRCGMNCAIEYADALPWARNHYNLSSYKLGDVAESIGVSTANAHRAMGDCKMLGAIVRDMMIQ